jgi:hypothetical protein
MVLFPGSNVNIVVEGDQGMCGLKIVRRCRRWAEPATFLSLQALFSFEAGWDRFCGIQTATIYNKLM